MNVFALCDSCVDTIIERLSRVHRGIGEMYAFFCTRSGLLRKVAPTATGPRRRSLSIVRIAAATSVMVLKVWKILKGKRNFDRKRVVLARQDERMGRNWVLHERAGLGV